MARCDLSDFRVMRDSDLAAEQGAGIARVNDRRMLNGIFWRLRTGLLGGHSVPLWPAHDLREPLQPVAQERTF